MSNEEYEFEERIYEEDRRDDVREMFNKMIEKEFERVGVQYNKYNQYNLKDK